MRSRARDAASLVLLRDGSSGAEVLMGRRSSRHRFVPGQYVFPGGRVDSSDHRASTLTPLRADVARRLAVGCAPARARAIAVAAARETFEETGLALGEIRDQKLVPALDRLEFVLRAITPVGWPIRFHARFFLARASAFTGELKSNGELVDLAWRPVADSLKLPLVDVTQYLLEQLAAGALHVNQDRTPLFCFLKGQVRVL